MERAERRTAVISKWKQIRNEKWKRGREKPMKGDKDADKHSRRRAVRR
jgi:hypothetical protein